MIAGHHQTFPDHSSFEAMIRKMSERVLKVEVSLIDMI